MWRRRLKSLRVAGALLVGGGLTLALLDFREAVPTALGHWLASVQFVPATLAAATGRGLVACGLLAALLGLTLLFGRVYCSVLCPLGILQDGIARVDAWRRGAPRRLPYAKPRSALQQGFLWAAVAGLAAGWGGLTLALFDPYSHFGRIVSGLARPLAVLLNNAVVGLGEWLGRPLLYRVTPPWAGFAALLLPLALLLVVGVLAALRGRLFCNTACPVGTILGLISRRAAWRLAIDQKACVKCGDCLRVCKAQCIDLKAGTVDAARCVACFNCLGACNELGIAHELAWTPARPTRDEEAADEETAPDPVVPLAGAPSDPGRRALLAGAAAAALTAGPAAKVLAAATEPAADLNAGPAVCPPGADNLERYLARCTACHLCVSACPTHVLQPAHLHYGFAGWLRPRLDFGVSYCNYDCRRCGEVCPTGAIGLLELPVKQVTRIGRAVLDEDQCVVKRDGTECAACSEHCPTKAVDTVPYRDGLRLPQVKAEYCIGCGACEFACPVTPVKAIRVTARRHHELAEKAVEAKPVAPVAGGAFPF